MTIHVNETWFKIKPSIIRDAGLGLTLIFSASSEGKGIRLLMLNDEVENKKGDGRYYNFNEKGDLDSTGSLLSDGESVGVYKEPPKKEAIPVPSIPCEIAPNGMGDKDSAEFIQPMRDPSYDYELIKIYLDGSLIEIPRMGEVRLYRLLLASSPIPLSIKRTDKDGHSSKIIGLMNNALDDELLNDEDRLIILRQSEAEYTSKA